MLETIRKIRRSARTTGPGMRSGDDESDREFEGEEAARVIDEAFSFYDGREALGQAESRGDGADGDSVGGADDGTENEPEAEVEAGENPLRDVGDGANREYDEAEGEHGDTDKVVTEVPPGGDKRRRKKKRREDNEKNDVWIQRDVRNAREETENQAADDEDDRVGRRKTLGERGEARDEEQQEQED